MIGLQTLGSVDMPGSGERKMPAPRSYLAIIVLFEILHIISDMGAARAASVAGWVTVLIGILKGPFGGQITNMINTVAPPGPGVSPLQPTPPDTSGGTP